MKHLLLTLMVMLALKSNSQTIFTDSFYRDNQWWYCSQPKTDLVRNFYPIKYLNKDKDCGELIPMFATVIENDACDLKNCKTYLDERYGWVDVTNESFKALNIPKNSMLYFNSCVVEYKGKQVPLVRSSRQQLLGDTPYRFTGMQLLPCLNCSNNIKNLKNK